MIMVRGVIAEWSRLMRQSDLHDHVLLHDRGEFVAV